MQTHNIPIESLTPKKGIKAKLENGVLHVPAEKTNLGKGRHHIYVPGKYKLPFRIDMTVKLDFFRTNQIASQLRLYIGKGNVYFNGGHTSTTDILTITKSSVFGDNKMTSYLCYNGIPSKEYVNISVIFSSKMMWALVDDACCYASDKLPYIELLRNNAVPDEFTDGIDIAICGGTDTKMTIKTFAVTEYENDEPSIPKTLRNLPELTPFEMYVKGLPPAIHDVMYKMDAYLLNDMKSTLKFRRAIDKHGHLTYQSPCGLGFRIGEFGVGQSLGTTWVNGSKKTDLIESIFKKLAETSPEFAEKIFSYTQICDPQHADARGCGSRVTINFMGKSRRVCAGKIHYDMTQAGFEDVKKYIAAMGEVIKTTGKSK